MEPNKKIENTAAQTAKPVQAQGGNKTLLWILGGCLVLLVIGGLVVGGVAYWSYKKVKNESKMKDAAIVQQQKQLEAAKIEAQKKQEKAPESVPTNIPEEPAVQPPASEAPAAAEGTTPYVGEKQIGFVKKVYVKSGKNYLNIDYVQWLTGDTAEKALREDGKCPKTGECIVYNGYYIRNQNPLIRTFEIASDVKIVMQTYSAEQTGIVMNNEEITFDQFKNIFSSGSESDFHLKDVPYIVEISNQQIVKITEQYIP